MRLFMTEPSLLPAARMEGLALLPLASPCPRIPRARISRQPGRWAHLGCRYWCQGWWREDWIGCVLGTGVTSVFTTVLRGESTFRLVLILNTSKLRLGD